MKIFSGQVETKLILETSQLPSNDPVVVATPTIPSVAKPCKKNMQILPSNCKPSKTTSNSGSEITKDNIYLSTSHSKTLMSNISGPFSTVCAEASPKISSKAESDTKCVPHSPTALPKDRELTKIFFTTTYHQDHWKSSNRDIREDPRGLKMSQGTKTTVNRVELSDVPCEGNKQNPDCSEHRIYHRIPPQRPKEPQRPLHVKSLKPTCHQEQPSPKL